MERAGRPYRPDEVLPYVVFEPKQTGRRAQRNGQTRNFDGHAINMASNRLQVFALKGLICVTCGLEGQVFYKERPRGVSTYHLNLYGVTWSGTEVLMTKDHIVPASKGGPDTLDNYQPMCARCNGAKGSRG